MMGDLTQIREYLEVRKAHLESLMEGLSKYDSAKTGLGASRDEVQLTLDLVNRVFRMESDPSSTVTRKAGL